MSGDTEETIRRCKLLLAYLISRAPRPLTRTMLMKLAFLADLEYKRRYGRTFTGAKYIMYLFGPFSMEVMRALQELVDEGAVSEERISADGEYTYYLYHPLSKCDQLAEYFERAHRDASEVASKVLEEYAMLPLDELLSRVYSMDEVRSAEILERVL